MGEQEIGSRAAAEPIWGPVALVLVFAVLSHPPVASYFRRYWKVAANDKRGNGMTGLLATFVVGLFALGVLTFMGRVPFDLVFGFAILTMIVSALIALSLKRK